MGKFSRHDTAQKTFKLFIFHEKNQHKKLTSSYFTALLTFIANRSLCNIAHRQYHCANFPPIFVFIVLAVNSPIFDVGT